MRINKNLFALALGSALLALSPLMANAGVNEMAKKCDECHGKGGNSTKEKVPTIAGFSAATLEDILTQYKEGDRKGVEFKKDDGTKTDMNAVAKKLSEADIKALAKHYAAQKFKPHKQAFDAKLAKKGAKLHDRKCEKCHSDGGTNPEDDAALLAGQWRAYLEEQFQLIKDRDRHVPKKMWKKFKKLNDAKIKALIEYYVSQQ